MLRERIPKFKAMSAFERQMQAGCGDGNEHHVTGLNG
jgi:hypothetical protein